MICIGLICIGSTPNGLVVNEEQQSMNSLIASCFVSVNVPKGDRPRVVKEILCQG